MQFQKWSENGPLNRMWPPFPPSPPSGPPQGRLVSLKFNNQGVFKIEVGKDERFIMVEDKIFKSISVITWNQQKKIVNRKVSFKINATF